MMLRGGCCVFPVYVCVFVYVCVCVSGFVCMTLRVGCCVCPVYVCMHARLLETNMLIYACKHRYIHAQNTPGVGCELRQRLVGLGASILLWLLRGDGLYVCCVCVRKIVCVCVCVM